jgi:L-threonylcarbamoyladenylate synthase
LREVAVDGEGDPGFVVREGALLGADGTETGCRILDVDLGGDVRAVAHGLFAALRELDSLGADVIFVEESATATTLPRRS